MSNDPNESTTKLLRENYGVYEKEKSIKGRSDSLVRSLHSVPRRHYFSVGSAVAAGSVVLADCWREPLHTLPTSRPQSGRMQTGITWLKVDNLKNIKHTMADR
ncbi:hypothetical protein TNCV_1764981 [Trichonephila clavipes]|nr:hypothetical protein TNCV_1764981 [Trichonephila clavipes]